MCCTAALPAFANDYLDYRQDRTRQNLSEYHRDFNEADVELPPVPNPDAEGWFELYIGNTFAGHPRILLDSITYAPDGSVRYLFNNRSAKGMDNVTAEGIYCVSGKKLLDSEGSLLKTFAYADLANNRWIMPRNAGWQTLGSQRNSSDRVRQINRFQAAPQPQPARQPEKHPILIIYNWLKPPTALYHFYLSQQ